MKHSPSPDEVAQVISVNPNRIRFAVLDMERFRQGGSNAEPSESVDEVHLRVGSYVRITDYDEGAILAVIENFTLEPAQDNIPARQVIEAVPVGHVDTDGKFTRGGTRITIPPAGVEPAHPDEVRRIYDQVPPVQRFAFSRLAQRPEVEVAVDGDAFFNKHLAIVGSTGCGKSHTTARILRNAIQSKDGYDGLNNAHILLFDLHGEYSTASPSANLVDVGSLALPYWLMNGEELEELLIETGENQAYNQTSLLRRLIVENKTFHSAPPDVSIDAPTRFDIHQVICALDNLNREQVRSRSVLTAVVDDGSEAGSDLSFVDDAERFRTYFAKELTFKSSTKRDDTATKGGSFKDLDRLLSRLRGKVEDRRLRFLFADEHQERNLEEVLRDLLGYRRGGEANITVLDLSGVPFEVLSITVSLITRLVFDLAYHLKRLQRSSTDTREMPFLLVYEEAHKYVPRGTGTRERACRTSIERIAKEGRKYGVTLAIVSQRPSEVSETIFSQCNNFVSMRLTNPDDQGYVRRLLPDTLGPLTEALPTLGQGDALLIGDAIAMPAWVHVDPLDGDDKPSSRDIPYYQEWKKPWADTPFTPVAERWLRRMGHA